MDNIENISEKKTPNEYGIIDPQPEKCNHKIKSRNTSIFLFDSVRTFTFPEHRYGICKYCGKPFHYIRKEDGSLILYQKEKEEEGQDVNNARN